MPKRQKYALMAVFALGGFTCLISILRLQSLVVVSRSDDISWENPLAAIWSSTELNVGIICSCLPTLKGCISRVFPRLFSSTNAGPSSGRDVQQRGDEGGFGGRKGITYIRTYDVQTGDGSSHQMPEHMAGWRPDVGPTRAGEHIRPGRHSPLTEEVDAIELTSSQSVSQLV
ncbi:uncharacterized protein LTR77_010104 [Saxophila tyrrhenica]|uniref:Rhodopsin domain-containing protein n=1 Tax=Saxophila tyrrhenica TaxID=1690608 RepID=A0AAV9NZP5_9PEZI|nr:hypothetical protein LTR77_010104 [Saxophila tyrrhenica]